jgi:hypothetical protein
MVMAMVTAVAGKPAKAHHIDGLFFVRRLATAINKWRKNLHSFTKSSQLPRNTPGS